ncbi:hypothetical protein KAT08_01510 [Candidatus Babeliales bacterium]|nr:hypothetical protein [Candidatus Babeliales bacterium]
MSKYFIKIFVICINFSFFFSNHKGFSINNIRDPFLSYQEKNQIKIGQENFNSFKDFIFLNGILEYEDGFGAILKKGQDKKVVFINDLVWGYQVKKITINNIEIKKGDKVVRLSIE